MKNQYNLTSINCKIESKFQCGLLADKTHTFQHYWHIEGALSDYSLCTCGHWLMAHRNSTLLGWRWLQVFLMQIESHWESILRFRPNIILITIPLFSLKVWKLSEVLKFLQSWVPREFQYGFMLWFRIAQMKAFWKRVRLLQIYALFQSRSEPD
jgi:hypothetical protein